MTRATTEQRSVKRSQQSDIVLSIEHVSKKFCRNLKRSLYYGIQDIATELAGIRKQRHSLRSEEFWALKDVNFKLRRGEAVGLVGPNGSGKTTLLRIISGLITPDAGAVKVKGRIAPLIALGAGFNPILTGRENLYVNMSILGLTKEEIDQRFDQVLEFAEIGEAIDAPVQTYSSGMAARLGFASAIFTEPDILLIDEVLAVGDIKFRAKCHRRLHELRQKGTSFILVSHQPQAIMTICNKTVYLLRGDLRAVGETGSIINKYENDLFANTITHTPGYLSKPEKDQNESLGLDILSMGFRDANGNQITAPNSGERIFLCIKCIARRSIKDFGLVITVNELMGEGHTTLFLNSFYDQESLNASSGTHEIQIDMPYLGLKVGAYTMKVLIREDALYTLDFVESFRFRVGGESKVDKGKYYQPRQWRIKDCL